MDIILAVQPILFDAITRRERHNETARTLMGGIDAIRRTGRGWLADELAAAARAHQREAWVIEKWLDRVLRGIGPRGYA